MGWLRLVGSLKVKVSNAREPYKRDDILQKRPIILRSLLIVATPYVYISTYTYTYVYVDLCVYLHIHIHMYVEVCVCVCVCGEIFPPKHTQTHTLHISAYKYQIQGGKNA